METRSARYLVMAVIAFGVAAFGVAACGGDGPTDAGSAPERPPSTATSEPTGEPPEGRAPTATATEASTPSTGPEGNERSGGTTTTGPAMPFVADTRPDTSSTTEGFPVLVSVTKGDHPGYVRYVFDFDDNRPEGRRAEGARPAWDVRYVPRSEVVQDGSGFPVPVEGAAVLRISFQGAAMHWDDGSVSLRHSRDVHERLRFGGDFEGYVTWFLGLDGERPFRAFFTGSDKVVVDVVTR